MTWPAPHTQATMDIVKKPMAISIRRSEAVTNVPDVAPQKKTDTPKIIHKKESQQVTPSKINPTLSPRVSPSVTAVESTDQANKSNNFTVKENQNISIFDLKSVAIKKNKHTLLNDNNVLIKQSVSSQGSQQASPQSGSIPKYPRNAIRRQQEGRVVVSLTVNATGRSSDVQVRHSSGYYLLDKAVLRFVKHEHFHPASQNNIPYTSKQEFSFVFILSP